MIYAEQRLRTVVSDRHTFFDACWAHQKLIRLMRQAVESPPRPESAISLRQILKVCWDCHVAQVPYRCRVNFSPASRGNPSYMISARDDLVNCNSRMACLFVATCGDGCVYRLLGPDSAWVNNAHSGDGAPP